MRVKPTLKSVLFGTLFYAFVFSLIRLIFDGIPKSNNDLLKIIVPAIIGGLIFTFIFGFLMDKFVSSKSVLNSLDIKDELAEGENILFETGANNFRNNEGVGGKIYLTETRFIFKSHKYNIQKYLISLPYTDIQTTTRTKTMGIINNGLTITAGEKTEKFVVAGRDKTFQEIEQRINATD